MTYVLNNADVLPVPVYAEAATTAPQQPGLLRRFYAAMLESRRRSAARELRARNLLVNETGIMLGGIPFSPLAEDGSLPFIR